MGGGILADLRDTPVNRYAMWADEDSRLTSDEGIAEPPEYSVDTSNVVYGYSYDSGIRGVNVDTDKPSGDAVEDIYSVAVFTSSELGMGEAGDLYICVFTGSASTVMQDVYVKISMNPAVTAHMDYVDSKHLLVIDVVYEYFPPEPFKPSIAHKRYTQIDEGELGEGINDFNVTGPNGVSSGYGDPCGTPDVVYNWYDDSLECVFWVWDNDYLGKIVYASYDGSWNNQGQISQAGVYNPHDPKIDIGHIDIDGQVLAVMVVWLEQYNFYNRLWVTGWDVVNDDPPPTTWGGFIPFPSGWTDTHSERPFVDINPKEASGESSIEDLAHIVWYQRKQTTPYYGVFYTNTHNIADIIDDTDDWDTWLVSNDNYHSTFPEVVAYADNSYAGKITYASDEDGTDQVWMADLSFSTPSSPSFSYKAALPDDDNSTYLEDPFMAPSMSLCFPTTLRALWSDNREVYSWNIYTNYDE